MHERKRNSAQETSDHFKKYMATPPAGTKHRHERFPPGTRGLSLSSDTNSQTLTPPSSGANLRWHTLTFLAQSSPIFRRYPGVPSAPAPTSSLCCTETLPSPLWPWSGRWGWWGCSAAASAPHLRSASVERTVRIDAHTASETMCFSVKHAQTPSEHRLK